MSTKQAKAATKITAQRRWCLTGTPIQNSMDDLRSLLTFLHLAPYSSRDIFEKHIVDPLRMDTPDSFRNLRLLLQCFCLRRNSDYLQLPDPLLEEVLVPLYAAEREEYQRIKEQCRLEFDDIVSQRSTQKRHTILFSAVQKVRQICSYGSFGPSNGHASSARASSKIGDPSESECEFCKDDNEDAQLLLEDYAVCPECCWCLEKLTRAGGKQRGSLKSPSVLTPDTLASTAATSPTPSPGLPLSLSQIVGSPITFGVRQGVSSKLDRVVEDICTHRQSKRSGHFLSQTKSYC